MWCKSLTLEKYISFQMKWFFSPPFLSVSSFLLLNLVRRQCYAYATGLYTRPEIKSWPDVKFCAHAQCVLPRCYHDLIPVYQLQLLGQFWQLTPKLLTSITYVTKVVLLQQNVQTRVTSGYKSHLKQEFKFRRIHLGHQNGRHYI